MNVRCEVLFVIWVAFVTCNLVGTQAGPAENYIDAQLRAVRTMESQVDRITQIAEESASRVLAGGSIYLAGEKGMVAELLGRAGGLCAAKRLDADKPLPCLAINDVVIFSHYGPATTCKTSAWQNVTGSGVLVVAFAAIENPILRQPLPSGVRAIPVDITADAFLVKQSFGQSFIPLPSPAIAMAQWTYVAELIAACRRQHKHLAVYLSLNLDEGRKRFERTKGLMFDPEYADTPIAAGTLGRQFIASVRRSLEVIRASQVGPIRDAAGWVREAAKSGKQLVRNLHGHLPPLDVGGPGDVPYFSQSIRTVGDAGAQWIREHLHAGDLYLFVGYQDNEDKMSAAANGLGAQTIFITSSSSGLQQLKNKLHLYINPHWAIYDGCVDLPGYDVKACPVSAILGMTCYWAICAEAVTKP
ncbi:MAG: hypothetical protein PHR77_18345 [Kiritimatiellae bacterium]|nr:hypothetical protein [Kiritimatiellia bacterium]MDD5523290.1 hypothetical protein [Kiritimatiellia bacterium]